MEEICLSRFCEIFKNVYPRFLAYARTLVGYNNAEDVVEDVCTDLWKRRQEIEMGDKNNFCVT